MKLEIVQKAKRVAEDYEVQRKQVHNWSVKVQQLIGELHINHRAEIVYSGNNAHHHELMSIVYSWVTNHIRKVTVPIFVLSRTF